MAFIDDIQSRDTALYPFVQIGINHNNVALPTSIRISTKAVTLFQASGNDELAGDWFYRPLLLSSPSIKESIDLENRKYKISNVSLKISNVEYNGERVSDNPELKINARTRIKWMSPSLTRSNDGYTAYIGVIRAITHDDKTCNITLEDTSQAILQKDVPVDILNPGSDNIPDMYKNKPIPMVYGNVDKSPVVIATWGEDQVQGEFYILADRTEALGDVPALSISEINNISLRGVGTGSFDYGNVTNFAINNPAYLQVSEDGNSGYLLADVYRDGDEWTSGTGKQFSVNSNSSIIGYKYSEGGGSTDINYSPLASGTVQAISIDDIIPSNFKIDTIPPSVSFTVHDETISETGEIGFSYPYYSDGAEEATLLPVGLDHEYQATPSIFYEEGGLLLGFQYWDEDAQNDLRLQQTTINFPSPVFADDGMFQSASYRLDDLYLHINEEVAASNADLDTGYSFLVWRDLLLGTYVESGGFNFIGMWSPTYNAGTFTNLNTPIYYTGLDHSGGDNSLSITTLPPWNGFLQIDKMEYAIRLERIYHLEENTFRKEKLYAMVSGRDT